MKREIEDSVKRIIAFYGNKGITVKEIWYEAEVRVGFVVRYSINEETREMRMTGEDIEKNRSEVEKIIAPYRNKKGIGIKIETESEIRITEVLPPLCNKDDIRQIPVGDADDVEELLVVSF